MDKDYKIAGIVSFLYVILTVTSIFRNTLAVGFLFMLFIYPYLLLKLKNYIYYRHGITSLNMVFYTVVFCIIVSSACALIIPGLVINASSENLRVVGVYFINLLLVLRGASFIFLGSMLISKTNKLNITLRIVAIFFLLFGIHTVLVGNIPIFPKVYEIIAINHIDAVVAIIEFSLLFIQVVIFLCLTYIFIKYNVNDDVNDESCR